MKKVMILCSMQGIALVFFEEVRMQKYVQKYALCAAVAAVAAFVPLAASAGHGGGGGHSGGNGLTGILSGLGGLIGGNNNNGGAGYSPPTAPPSGQYWKWTGQQWVPSGPCNTQSPYCRYQ
jgi:hypothetical protein